jgi:hypothetical protein
MTTDFYYWPWFEDIEAIVLFFCFPIVCFFGERARGVSILSVFYAIACYCVDLYELNPNANDTAQTILIVKWVIWALVMLLGCLVACCLLKLALIVAGAAAFGLVANLLYQLILSAGLPDFLYARLIVIIIFAIVGALIALKFLKFAFRLFTPVIGGFFCVAAVDHFGNFIGWWTIRPFFPRPEPRGQFFSHPEQFPWNDPKHAAGLLVLWIVLTAIGLAVQFLFARRRNKEVIVHETVVQRDEPVHNGTPVEVVTQR